jgi:hypothetical protein
VDAGHVMELTWHEIAGTVLWKGGLLGLLRWGPRKKGEPLRQTHLATIHIHVHTLINLSEIKSKANPIKKSMIPVPGEGRVTFSPPLKYAPATLLLIPPPSF